jgi:hypothetical protein
MVGNAPESLPTASLAGGTNHAVDLHLPLLFLLRLISMRTLRSLGDVARDKGLYLSFRNDVHSAT